MGFEMKGYGILYYWWLLHIVELTLNILQVI